MSGAWQTRVTERVKAFVDATGIGALCLAIRQDGELIYNDGFGAGVTADTLLPSCSAAKPVTALVVMRAVEEGLLALDRPVIEYLPDLRYPPGGDVHQVTLRQLLSHTSGLASDPDFADAFFDSPDSALAWHVFEEIPRLAAIEPNLAPIYSNPGFNLAGFLAAEVQGRNFVDLAQAVVLDPLQMSRTTYDRGAVPIDSGPVLPRFDPRRAPPIAYPAGGAVTTAADLTQLGTGLIDDSVIGAETRASMQTVHADALSRPPRWYGLGLTLGRDSSLYGGWQPLMHGGGGFGGGANLLVVAEQKAAAAVLFDHPAGYGLNLMELVSDHIGRGPGRQPRSATHYTPGRYTRLVELDGFPTAFDVIEDRTDRRLLIDGDARLLKPFADGVYITDDEAVTIGFERDGRYAMFDPYGIGLVSAMPFRRAD